MGSDSYSDMHCKSPHNATPRRRVVSKTAPRRQLSHPTRQNGRSIVTSTRKNTSSPSLSRKTSPSQLSSVLSTPVTIPSRFESINPRRNTPDINMLTELSNMYPEPRMNRIGRHFESLWNERQDRKRWAKWVNGRQTMSFDAQYAMEIYKLLNEGLMNPLSQYKAELFEASQQAHDQEQPISLHVANIIATHQEYTTRLIEYLYNEGVPLPWTPEQIEPIIPYVGYIDIPLGVQFHIQTLKWIKDHPLHELTSALRQEIALHDVHMYAFAFAIDETRLSNAHMSLDIAIRIQRRFNAFLATPTTHARLTNRLYRDVDFIGSFEQDEINAWQQERFESLQMPLSESLQQILQTEFQYRGIDGYILATKAMREQYANNELLSLLAIWNQTIYDDYLKPPADTPATRRQIEKEQQRRHAVVSDNPKLANEAIPRSPQGSIDQAERHREEMAQAELVAEKAAAMEHKIATTHTPTTTTTSLTEKATETTTTEEQEDQQPQIPENVFVTPDPTKKLSKLQNPFKR